MGETMKVVMEINRMVVGFDGGMKRDDEVGDEFWWRLAVKNGC